MREKVSKNISRTQTIDKYSQRQAAVAKTAACTWNDACLNGIGSR